MKKLLILIVLLSACGASHVTKNTSRVDAVGHDSTAKSTAAKSDSSRTVGHDSTNRETTQIPLYLLGTPLARLYDSLNALQLKAHQPIYLPGSVVTRFVHIHDQSTTNVNKYVKTAYVYVTRTITKTVTITKDKTADDTVVKNMGGHTFLYIAAATVLIFGTFYTIWHIRRASTSKA